MCVSSNYIWKIRTKIEGQRHCMEETPPISGAFKSSAVYGVWNLALNVIPYSIEISSLSVSFSYSLERNL